MPPSRAEVAAKRARLIELAAAGTPTAVIARQLGMDRRDVRRIRNQAGHPAPEHVRQPLTLEQKWRSKTRPVDGGHLEWLGSRAQASGTPVLRYGEQMYTAYRIAFRIRTGRDPIGQAKPSCEYPQCVAPDCVDDTAIRNRDRGALRAVVGMSAPPEDCGNGHGPADRQFSPDGVSYCAGCI